MATLKLGTTTVMTESSGFISNIPASGVTGTLPNAVQDNITRLGTITSGNINTGFKVHTHSFTGDSGDQSSDPRIFGTSLEISESNNPNGAKFLVIAGGGRSATDTLMTFGTYFMEGASPTWTTTSGTRTSNVIGPCKETDDGWTSGFQNAVGIYENDTGSATPVEFRVGFETTGGNGRLYSNDSTHAHFGIIAYKMY